MKTKFIASVALLAWLGVTGWLASMAIAKPAVLRLGNNSDETAQMVELRAAIQRNQRIGEQLDLLRGDSLSSDSQSLLAVAQIDSPAVDAYGSHGIAGTPSTVPMEREISMVMVTDGRRSAIVNGQHVRAGTRLADGSRVRAIGSDWVRIETLEGERTDHPVPSPFQSQPTGRN